MLLREVPHGGSRRIRYAGGYLHGVPLRHLGSRIPARAQGVVAGQLFIQKLPVPILQVVLGPPPPHVDPGSVLQLVPPEVVLRYPGFFPPATPSRGSPHRPPEGNGPEECVVQIGHIGHPTCKPKWQRAPSVCSWRHRLLGCCSWST